MSIDCFSGLPKIALWNTEPQPPYFKQIENKGGGDVLCLFIALGQIRLGYIRYLGAPQGKDTGKVQKKNYPFTKGGGARYANRQRTDEVKK